MNRMAQILAYTIGDQDFYAPLETAAAVGDRYTPTRVPAGWHSVGQTIWTMWLPADVSGVAEDGWKVHVSARPERVAHVLDTVADACFDQGVPFKHLATKLFLRWTQGRYGPRQQGGKLIAAYPRDVECARRLMERLHDELAGEVGPFILSDRRYRDSRTVHYRYGAFVHRQTVTADGRRVLQVRDGAGALVPDRRGVSAHLPEGVVDPFLQSSVDRQDPGPRPSPLRGFEVDVALQFTNAGGVYRGRDTYTGRSVIIKEARSHTGLGPHDSTATDQLRAEWNVLAALREVAPGLAPAPLAYLRAWEHEFLVMELVPGQTLGKWIAAHHPDLRAGQGATDLTGYYTRCERIVAEVERQLARMHAVGFAFGDVSPNNILVDSDDSVRLIDFGSAHRVGAGTLRFGTPGFAPPDPSETDDGTGFDDYGVSALALALLSPLNQVVSHNPQVLTHAYRDLAERAPVPDSLWRRATRHHDLSGRPRLPGPDEVAADPVRHLSDLRDRVARGIVAAADPDHEGRIFPTIVDGYETNTVCVAYGTAGVVHALRQANWPVPDGVVARLRRDALAGVDRLAPGLHVGTAGIARVLADEGLLDEACDVLAAADRHPITTECATLAGGSAGVALAHLSLYTHTGDPHHIDRALALAEALPPDDDLTPLLGRDDATGLLHGRCGVALMLQQLGTATGDGTLVDRAVRLLHAELDRALDPRAAGLHFPVSTRDRRAMPYLYCGSAGMAYAVTRCLSERDDERLAEALPRILATLGLTVTVMAGLYQGIAGFAFALADHARLTGSEASRQAGLRVARALFKHAVPHEDGVRFLGDGLLRFSTELWSGSAGVLLALCQLLKPRPDGLFAVEATPQAQSPLALTTSTTMT